MRPSRAVFIILLSLAASGPFLACSGGPSRSSRPVSQTFDDATITARVKTVLLNDTQVGALQINVTSTNGAVTLSGTVKSAADSERAVELAKTVAGVRSVDSQLTVQPQ